VQGFTVPFKDSWQQVLERNLNLYLPGQGKYKQAEVINAGIGGYVSWQVKKRLVKRGIKYKPDVVMVLAGTNDMVYSALPNWTPDIDLSKIENAYLKQAPPANTPIQIKDLLLKSRIIQLARNARNNRNHKAYIREVISEHQKDSNIAFNQKALDLYLANLEEMYKTIKSNGATMVLLTYPIIINGTLAQNSELNERMVVFYQGFPLSANEFVKWHQIYTAAEKDFAKRHDDILLIDLAGEWEQKGKEERLKLFVDQVHHTKYGHEVFAKDVFDEITKQYKVIMEK
jgi:lysophospholipase L1-like esterase